ncbi:MAG: sulfur carrier protein ThiS [Candidatus Binatia bacterium]
MQVIINGDAHTLAEGVTIADVVNRLGLNRRRIAVERNREIVAREAYGSLVLADGDCIEIVHFVGGG